MKEFTGLHANTYKKAKSELKPLQALMPKQKRNNLNKGI